MKRVIIGIAAVIGVVSIGSPARAGIFDEVTDAVRDVGGALDETTETVRQGKELGQELGGDERRSSDAVPVQAPAPTPSGTYVPDSVGYPSGSSSAYPSTEMEASGLDSGTTSLGYPPTPGGYVTEPSMEVDASGNLVDPAALPTSEQYVQYPDGTGGVVRKVLPMEFGTVLTEYQAHDLALFAAPNPVSNQGTIAVGTRTVGFTLQGPLNPDALVRIMQAIIGTPTAATVQVK